MTKEELNNLFKGTKNKNKRVLNATPTTYNGIKFKSKLEVTIYKTLIENGFKPNYEKYKYVIMKGFKPTKQFYAAKSGLLKQETTKVIDMTYTPDFTFTYKKHFIIIEGKGKPTDSYLLKRKLFKRYMEYNMEKTIFFEIVSKRQLLQAIQIIKSI